MSPITGWLVTRIRLIILILCSFFLAYQILSWITTSIVYTTIHRQLSLGPLSIPSTSSSSTSPPSTYSPTLIISQSGGQTQPQEDNQSVNPDRPGRCELYDPLYNMTRVINCTNEDFPSMIRSKCQTRLGNQLSSYAAVLFFQMKYPTLQGVMDSFQMRIIRSVFDMKKMSLRQMDLSKCCRRKKWKQVNALEIDKPTKVGLKIKDQFVENFSNYERNHVIMLGSHTMPIFLYKDILDTLIKEFQFRPGILNLARKFMNSLKSETKETVFVGIHARRGDRIYKWRTKRKWRRSFIGSYEGKFFNHVMDRMREEYNTNTRRVVFIPTSDDFPWIVKHLVNKDDIFYPKQKIAQTRVALPSNKEIGRIFSHMNLAVKGKES